MNTVGCAPLAAESTDSGPMHDPPLRPRDEAIFLLTAAAEVEHALMVQYLFAAYSLRLDGNIAQLASIQDELLQIAREEMGHLASVQNLLHILGGPLNFRREQSPYSSEIYPFRFKLQPLTLRSLSKYVIAESPAVLPDEMSEADKELICDTIEPQAQADNDSIPVQHVGPIFARLITLFEGGADGISDEDFFTGNSGYHARYEEWGYDPQGSPQDGDRLVVASVNGPSVGEVREQAVKALREIAEQGEGHDAPESPESASHFQRFFDIYKRLNKSTISGLIAFAWPLPVNPNTTSPPEGKQPGMEKMVEMVLEAHAAQGRISDPRALAWANLFNLRYRMLIAFLSHFLRLDGDSYLPSGPKQGDRTPRGLLLIWTFNEMRRLRKIALKLVQLKKDDTGTLNAGPPFELPYTLNLSEFEPARWRGHLDVSRAAVDLIQRELLASGSPDADDEFLHDLVRLDEDAQSIMESLAGGGGIPDGALPGDFQKVAHLLEEAVRGFTILSHSNFWDRKNRDAFIDDGPFGFATVKRNADGTFNADGSLLVQRIEEPDPLNRMPKYRPEIPESRRQFLREWIHNGCAHNGEVGIQRERDPRTEPAAPPNVPGGTLGFDADIKPLFRETPDRSMMLLFGIDLHDFAQVSDRADRILSRLQDGSMPCDAAWPPERVALFERWIADGKHP